MNKIFTHTIRIVAMTAVSSLVIAYPFLPGKYDFAAISLSLFTQLFGILGITLLPVALAWLVHEIRVKQKDKQGLPYKKLTYPFAVTATIILSVVALPLTMLIFFSYSKAIAIIIFFTELLLLRRAITKLNLRKTTRHTGFNPAPLYLLIPSLVIVTQTTFANVLNKFSISTATANARELIQDIENYRQTNGHYPSSLLAQYSDYSPGVVGIEKYHYTTDGKSYNLFFEAPRLFISTIGAREWVVYNPQDEHKIYSHASWILHLSPSELDRSQGWYESKETEVPNWKSFMFD